jgi:hypothetical protein
MIVLVTLFAPGARERWRGAMSYLFRDWPSLAGVLWGLYSLKFHWVAIASAIP